MNQANNPSVLAKKIVKYAPEMYVALMQIHEYWKDVNFIYDNCENLVNTLKDIGYVVDKIIEKIGDEII